MFEGLNNTLVMIELELRRLRHDRTELYFRAVQPILWIVIYGPVMSSVRTIPTGGVPYTDFITPGIMVQTTTFVSIFYGLMMVWERDSGILKKLLVTPASRYSTVIGRAMASGVRALFQALIILPIALVIGVRFIPNPAYLILALTIIFFSSGGFAAISILVASFMKTRDEVFRIRTGHNYAAILREQRPIPHPDNAPNPERTLNLQPSKLCRRRSKRAINYGRTFKSDNRSDCYHYFRRIVIHFSVHKFQTHHRMRPIVILK